MDGNSTAQLDYTFRDLNSYPGITYYRLKQIDKDDHFSYSVIRAVKGFTDNLISVTLMPNPNNGRFKVIVHGSSGGFDGLIFDINGRLVQQVKIQAQQDVNVSHLSTGTYLFTIKDVFGKGKDFTEKILITH